MCAFTAAAVILGSIAIPVDVKADDDDDFLEDLVDLTPEEEKALQYLEDFDSDGDIDEDDAEALAATMLAEAMEREAAEQARAQEEEYRRQAAADAERERQMEIELERQRQATAEAEKQAAINAQKAADDARKALELEQKLKKEKEKNKSNSEQRATGIAVSSTDVVLTIGQTYQITAYVLPDNARNKRAYFSSSDSNVASVDGSGVIRGNSVGSCVIYSTSEDGGYKACTTVRVNPTAAQATQTVAQDANWTTIAANMIVAAAPGSVVNLVAPKAMSFDAGMINALKARPDVSLLIAYPYNGHTYAMAVPAGYNLSAKMDKNGKVSFVKLAGVKDGKIITTMVK